MFKPTSTEVPDNIPTQKSIKWSWLALSCVSLLTGALYLTNVDLTGPAAISQAESQHSE